MNLSETDYWIAACIDIAYEQLPVKTVEASYEVSDSAEDFFCAVQAAIKLKEMCDAHTRRH